jgi:sn-glycerol 3-phosphate transport system ATP-binding protein
MTLGDRLLVLRDGRTAQLGTPLDVFLRPADTYVAGFIGAPAMNFLPARLAASGRTAALAAGRQLPFADGRRAAGDGTPVTIGIRPEQVRLDPSGLPLAVDLVEPLGSETLIHGRLADGTRLVVKLAGPGLPEGPVAVTFPADALHVFDAVSGRRLEPAAAASDAATAPAA